MNSSLPHFSIPFHRINICFLAILILTGVFLSPLVTGTGVHDSLRMGKIFFFAQWMLLVIPVGMVVFIREWKQPVGLLSLLVLLWFGWIIVRGKTGGIWNDEKFFWFAGCVVFFFVAGSIFSVAVQKGQLWLLQVPVAVIVLIAAAEAAMGLLQLYGGYTVYHHLFKVTGTFFNPAPYAGFLLACLPWALLMTCLKRNTIINHIVYWIGYLALLLIIVVLPSTQSRAAYLGAAVAIAVWAFYCYKPLLYLKYFLNSRFKKIVSFGVVPVLALALLTGLYLFKKDSADGRLLIWKVALHTIKEKPFTGHGFNTAQATLAPAQAAYFAAGWGSVSQQMLAGSVRWVFNEPLQAASETGLPGALLLLLVAGYALFFKVRKPASGQQYTLLPLESKTGKQKVLFSRNSPLLPRDCIAWFNKQHIGAARATVAGVMVFGCFSYPFYSLPVTLLFFYALAVLAAFNWGWQLQNSFMKTGVKLAVLTATVLLGIYYLVQTPKLKQAYWLWDEASSLYRINAYAEANESFAEAYPVLKYNGLFLQQYGKSLAMEERYHEAVDCLTEAEKYYKDEFGYITLGDCYKALGETHKAEEQYQLAAHMVPHKFYPLYLLAKLYSETGQHKKAVLLARQLLEKEVKVPSQAIQEMQVEMEQIISAHTNAQSGNKMKGDNYTYLCPIGFKLQFW